MPLVQQTSAISASYSSQRFVLRLVAVLFIEGVIGCRVSSSPEAPKSAVPQVARVQAEAQAQKGNQGGVSCSVKPLWPGALDGLEWAARPPPCSCTADLFWEWRPDESACQYVACPKVVALGPFGTQRGVYTAWSEDGEYFVRQFERGAGVFSRKSTELVFFDPTIQTSARAELVLGPKARWLACGGTKRVRVTGIEKGIPSREIALSDSVLSLETYGDWIVVRGNDQLHAIDATTGAVVDYAQIRRPDVMSSRVPSSDKFAVEAKDEIYMLGGSPPTIERTFERTSATFGEHPVQMVVSGTDNIEVVTQPNRPHQLVVHSWSAKRASWRTRIVPLEAKYGIRQGVSLLGDGQYLRWQVHRNVWHWTRYSMDEQKPLGNWSWRGFAGSADYPVNLSPLSDLALAGVKHTTTVVALNGVPAEWAISQSVRVPWGARLRVALDRRAFAFHVGAQGCWLTTHGAGGCRVFDSDVKSVTFASGGRSLLVATQKASYSLDGHSSEVVPLSQANGFVDWVAIGGTSFFAALDKAARGVALWSVDQQKVAQSVPQSSRCRKLASSEQGLYCLSGSGELLFWRDPTLPPRVELRGLGRANRMASTRDGLYFAIEAADKTLRLWSTAEKEWSPLDPVTTPAIRFWNAGSPWWIDSAAGKFQSRFQKWGHGRDFSGEELPAPLSDAEAANGSSFGRIELRNLGAAVEIGNVMVAFVPRFAPPTLTTHQAHALLLAPDGRYAEYGPPELGQPWYCTRAGQFVAKSECHRLDGATLVSSLLSEKPGCSGS